MWRKDLVCVCDDVLGHCPYKADGLNLLFSCHENIYIVPEELDQKYILAASTRDCNIKVTFGTLTS